MRGRGTPVALAALVGSAVLAGGEAAGAPASDIYITGAVVGRVPGKNASRVKILWAYKCLGDKLGSATYEWTLNVRRRSPLPQRTIVLGTGTSKFGSMIVNLPAGEYSPFSDPYRCETDRGAGYDKPEIGAPFVSLDYCAWTVVAVAGQAELEQGTTVKAARIGSVVPPSGALTTTKRARAELLGNARDGAADLAAATRLEVRGGGCETSKGGWNLRLAQGSVISSVPPAARPATYRLATANAATVRGPKARWRTAVVGPKTTVRALAGTVEVAGAKGAAVTLKRGTSTVVVGTAAPTKPR